MVREAQEEKAGGGSFKRPGSKRNVGIGENYATMLITPLSQRSQEWAGILVLEKKILKIPKTNSRLKWLD